MAKEIQIVLSAAEAKLIQGLRKGETAVNAYGRKTVGIFRQAGAAINRVGDRAMTKLNTFVGGAAIALAGREVINFDTKLARLTIQAGKTGGDMARLKQQLFEVAAATHQSPTELLEGVSAIVERTGNFQFAVNSLKSMGTVASATGARMEDIGATASNLQEKMGITEDKVMTVFDILNEQGKKGSFTLQNMASLFEGLLSAANRFDVKGVEGIRKFGAFLQIARRGTRSSEQAATAVERVVSDLIMRADLLEKSGFSIFDPVKSKAAGRMIMRDMDQVLKYIVVRSKGDVRILQKIFGEESIKAVTPLVESWKKFGDFREFDAFVKMGGDGATILKDFSFWSEQTAAKLRDFRTQISKFADQNLAGPVELLNKALSFLNANPAVAKGGIYGMLGLAGLFGASKIIRGIAGIFTGGAARGAGGIAGGLGRMAGGMAGGMPMPVYVVNKHLSMLPGKGFSGGLPGGAAGAGKLMSKLGPLLGKAGLVAGAGALGWAVGSLLNKLIDKAFGQKGGLGNWFYDITHRGEAERNKQQDALWAKYYEAKKSGDREQMKSLLNQIKLTVNIDKNGRVSTDSNDMNTNIDVERGGLMID